MFMAVGLVFFCMSLIVCCAADPEAMAQKLGTDGNAQYHPVAEGMDGADVAMEGGWGASAEAPRPGRVGELDVEID